MLKYTIEHQFLQKAMYSKKYIKKCKNDFLKKIKKFIFNLYGGTFFHKDSNDIEKTKNKIKK